ncbi:MAG TPA: PPK2 family polyphosphate kinase [Miltoncostaeaceae bacterium]|nr:PPK2 family polyphosphate kinase [Miltoncostaeaceae bacterium]
MRKGIRVKPGSKVSLADHRADAKLGIKDRAEADARVAELAPRLADLGALLAANRTKALLVVIQGMDASGKDGTIKHCISPFAPTALNIAAFKAPTSTELLHDFLWRVHSHCPERGQIGIFNRSHYEDVLVVRVEKLAPEEVWRPRYEAINAFERHLAHEGTVIVKLWLNISNEEQAKQLQQRLKDPTKNWKFSEDDIAKRANWDDYMDAYREMVERTSTDWAPWYVIPCNHRWVRNAVVSEILVETLESLEMSWPVLPEAVRRMRIE